MLLSCTTDLTDFYFINYYVTDADYNCSVEAWMSAEDGSCLEDDTAEENPDSRFVICFT
jgi:hypothetical protein